MASEPKTIHVNNWGELAWLIEAANKAPLILEKDGIRYRLSREEDGPWVNYDPEAVLTALRAAGGTLSPDEGEELKAFVYRAREEGSRPAYRP
jgi:hypothetical protein